MADQESLISQFAAISGADNERAKFYLESAAWNLESALGSFYEEGEESPTEPLGVRPEAEGAPNTPQQPSAQTTPQARINMIGQESDSSEDESGQAFYAGGSTHSGQQVLGPPKKKSDMVAKLFKSAKEHGAEVVEGSKDGKKSKKFNYSGTGYRLGETNDDTQVIPAAGKEEEEPRDVLLKMWRTGFTVDNGPLRSYEDPSNAEFLNSIRRGEIPLELIREARGGEVYINMADHRHEDYVAPKTSLRPFTGSGHSLGSPAPNVVGQVSHLSGAVGGASKTSAVSAASLDPKAAEKKAQDDLKIDSQQPTTNIQVRLPDGSRLIIKLNHTHAVSDIRQYISTARPSYETTEFALMTTFPHAEVTELSQTVAEAKLLNAALVVKPK
ncbi:NSFL1 cofactor p47-like isoform X2 [Macrobrachium nipponense]|uniref:NSFL1 cofactor p47-like isoform X2 n=1 Tax=Macrobrachium nipponense TaxID=159736 RepID=UPI0030C80910